ncbi:MAG: hypothetical protein HN337_00885 [Deltaproteobacteria bacterium]|jgi:hypothetical protein|nr:hypothetical protein [Deltaproteobacteria bacterium]
MNKKTSAKKSRAYEVVDDRFLKEIISAGKTFTKLGNLVNKQDYFKSKTLKNDVKKILTHFEKATKYYNSTIPKNDIKKIRDTVQTW